MAAIRGGVSLASKVGFQCFCRERRPAAGMLFKDLSIGRYNNLLGQHVFRFGKR